MLLMIFDAMGTLQSYSCRIPLKTSKQLSFFSTNPWPSMSWNPSACRCSSRIHWRAEFGIPWKKRSKWWWSKIDLSAVPRQHNTWRLPSKFRKTLPQQNWCDKQVSSWRHISCRTDKNRYSECHKARYTLMVHTHKFCHIMLSPNVMPSSSGTAVFFEQQPTAAHTLPAAIKRAGNCEMVSGLPCRSTQLIQVSHCTHPP